MRLGALLENPPPLQKKKKKFFTESLTQNLLTMVSEWPGSDPHPSGIHAGTCEGSMALFRPKRPMLGRPAFSFLSPAPFMVCLKKVSIAASGFSFVPEDKVGNFQSKSRNLLWKSVKNQGEGGGRKVPPFARAMRAIISSNSSKIISESSLFG